MTHGSVYLRGKTWWIRYYFKGKDRGESSHSTERKDAELLLAKRLGEIGADSAGIKRWLGPGAERVLVTALLDELITDYQISGKRSLRVVQTRSVPLRESFYRETVRDVDTPRLRRYVQERQKAGFAPATIRLELMALHRAFTLAYQDGKIGQVPVFPHIEVDNARQGFFEKEDLEAVCSFLPPVLSDMARFAYLSGWRKMEVQRLQWQEIDMQGGVARLSPERSKNKKGRTLPLVGELWEIISRRHPGRVLYDAGNGYREIIPWVFHRDGKPISEFKRAWASACRRAGVEGMLFHDLRRTAVRNLIRAGVGQRTAMEITGHRTASVFSRYDIVDMEDMRLAQEKMQAYLGAEPQERKIIPMGGRG